MTRELGNKYLNDSLLLYGPIHLSTRLLSECPYLQYNPLHEEIKFFLRKLIETTLIFTHVKVNKAKINWIICPDSNKNIALSPNHPSLLAV